MNRRTVLIFLLLGGAAAAAGSFLARMLAQPQLTLESGTWLPEPKSLAEFHLADLAGRRFGVENLRGSPTLLFFGFTSCPDICPTTLAMLTEVQRRAPLSGARVVFVTIDPERDSAANLRAYLDAFSKDFIGLRGDSQALSPLLKSLGAIAVRQPLPDGGYTMDHSATLYLLDTHGRLAAVFSPPFETTKLIADLASVARAERL